MNVSLKHIVPAVLMAASLAACSSMGAKKAEAPKAKAPAQVAPSIPEPQTVKVDAIDATKEVAYKCNKQSLNVMYGIKGNDVVAAQVKYQNQLSPTLFRVVGAQGVNAFWGNNVAWTADAANAANVANVNGSMLTIRQVTNVNGSQQVVDAIVDKGCVLDKAATAQLAKAKAVKAKAKK